MKQKRFKKVVEDGGMLYLAICMAICMAIPTYLSFFDLKDSYGFIGGVFWGVLITLCWIGVGYLIYQVIKQIEIHWEEIE